MHLGDFAGAIRRAGRGWRRLQQPRYLTRRELPNLWNDLRLRKLRDVHRGRRAFLVGNGPSLSYADLDMLRNEITFASNRIYLAFERTAWRPTYYTVTDTIIAENDQAIIRSIPAIRIFGSNMWEFYPNAKGVVFVNPPVADDMESWDLVKGSRNGFSVICLEIKIAWWLGIRELYVLGVDFDYPAKTEPTGQQRQSNVVVRILGQGNHFDDRYYRVGEEMLLPQLDTVRGEFLAARRFMESHGGRIRNASRRTKLDVWDRIPLEEALE